MAIQFFQTANFANTVTATSFVKDGGTSSQYLMADGSVSTGSSSDVAWDDITSKPTTISGFGITDAFSGSYADLTNVPSTFAPSAHNHDGTYLKLSGGTMTGDITMGGISPGKLKSNSNLILQVDADNNTSGAEFKLLGGGGSTLFKIAENGNIDAHGVINFTGTATTTSVDRGLYWTGFDKEATTDFTDNASITHTTNTGGHSGSVLEIKSMNDSGDGIAFTTHASSLLKHNGNAIFSEGHKPTWSEIDSKPSTFAPSAHNHAASNITSGTLATARLPEFIEEKYIFTSNDSNAVYMPMVKGGMYATSASSVTGQILIKMPSYKTNMMMQFYVDIYEYDTGESLTFRISGYNNNDSNATWYNCSVVNLSDDTDRDFAVRFGADTSNSFQYVTIGETNSVWSYPQVNVRDFYGGYNTLEAEAQGSFNVSFVTSTPGSVSRTHTGNLVATNWNNIANKPSSFTPASHNQAWSTITSTPTTLAGYGITDAAASNHNHDGTYVKIGATHSLGSVTRFQSNNEIDTSSGNQSPLEVFQDNAGHDAFMTFHISGDYAAYFGLDGASNDFVFGGWSKGAVKQRIFHEGHKPTWSEIESKPSTFAPSSHNHNDIYYTETESDSRFVNVTGDTMSGTLTASGGINGLTLANGGISGSNYNISGVNQLSINDPGEGIVFGGGSAGSITLAVVDDSNDNIVRFTNAAYLQVGTSTVWHSGNDGSGSNLDADKLDGQHGSYYYSSGNLPTKIKAGGTGPSTENLNTVANSVSTGQLEYRGFNSSSSNKPATSDNANGVITVGQHSGNYSAQLAFSSNGNVYWRDNPAGNHGSWRKMWDEGNDGSGSGLDADKLDGNHASAFATAGHNHDSTYVNVTGDTMTGQLTATKLRTNHNSSQAAPRYDTSFYVAQSQHYYGQNGSQTMYLGESGNDVLIRGQVAIGGTAIQSGYNLTMTGSIDMNANSIDYVNQLHFNDNVRFYDDGNDNYLNFRWGDTGAGGIRFRDGDYHVNGTVYGSGTQFGLLDADGSWAVRVQNNSAVDLRVNNSSRIICDTGGTEFRNGGTIVGEVTTSGLARFANDVVAYYSFSDQRLKTDIKATTNNLDKILKLEPVEYTWKDGGREGKKEIGLIAQDVEKVVPEVVRENERLNDDTLYKQVDYEHLVSTLIGAIQEQQDQIAELKSEVTNLKSTMCKCKK